MIDHKEMDALILDLETCVWFQKDDPIFGFLNLQSEVF